MINVISAIMSIKYQTLLQDTLGNLYGAAEEKSPDYRTLYI